MTFLRDLGRALRTLGRAPGYALTCIAILALGIGANTAIFSVVHSVILTPLPYPDVARLVFVWERLNNASEFFMERMPAARKNYVEWKQQATVFADMAAFVEKPLNESATDHARHISTGFVSVNLLPMLGAQPSLGRLFASAEERKDADRVAVLSDSYFDSRFHRDSSAIGKAITLGSAVYTVIGVLPARFHLPSTAEGSEQVKPEVWIPLSRLWDKPDDDMTRQLLVAARLKPGVSLTQARTEMSGIAARLSKSNPELNTTWTTSVYPFSVEDADPKLHLILAVLFAAAGFLLLIACANLANLTLARANLRSREIAVRLALGASRGQIISQLMAESVTISFLGTAAGMVVAHWCIQGMLALKPPDFQRPELIELNLSVFAFAAVVGLLTALLFGLAPAIYAGRTTLNSALKTGGGGGASAARLRSRQFLIAAEVALAVVLVSGAGLMIRSFRELVETGIGFDTSRLTAADIALPEARYTDAGTRSRFFRTLMDRARSIPGVTAASVIDNLPLHSVGVSDFLIEGRPEPPMGSRPMCDRAQISPEYFNTIGLPLRAGRFFTEADLVRNEQDKDALVIVNEAFVRKFFDGDSPIGKRLSNVDRKKAFEIIGVVADYRPIGVERGTRPQMFSTYLKLSNASVVVRARVPPETLANAIRRAVWSIDKDLPVDQLKTMTSRLDEFQSQRKFNTLLMLIFAGLALVLALIGVYGVLSNLVASRVREIGIRMAIGATPAGIGRMVLGQSMIPVTIGMILGLTGSLILSRLIETLLFQVSPRDPLTLGLAVGSILLLSPVAIWVPLRRAIGVDCTVALREE
jgi:putative ABC transport system permease protein